MKLNRYFLFLCALAALSGCGGGGRDAAPFTTSTPKHEGVAPMLSAKETAQAQNEGGLVDAASARDGRKGSSPDTPAAVFRFYNTARGVHFYTISVVERDRVKALPQFRYEGVAFYAMPAGNTTHLAVHRFLNRTNGTHFYTSSETEKISVEANLRHIYQYEGVAWRARSQPADGWVPMRRFYVAGSGVHFYTANEGEYLALVRRNVFTYEGIAYYVRASATGVGLDFTFGTDGRVVSSLQGLQYGTAGSARLSDGRLLVGGLCRTGDVHDFCVARYHSDGRLDTSFGTGGWAKQTVSTFRASASAMAVLPDGRIVVGGSCINLYELGNYFCMARFSADGESDSGFGTNGVSQFHVSALPYGGVGDELTDIAVADSGSLFVTGDCSSRFCAAKVQEDGTLDLSFGTQGVATVQGTGDIAPSRVVRLDSFGRLVIAGSCRSGSEAEAFCLRRLNADGTLDTAFGSGGLTRTVVTGSSSSNITALHHLPSGGWLATGSCLMGTVSSYDFCAVRYSEDGLQDESYGSSGAVVQAMQDGVRGEYSTASLLDTQGRLLMVGTCYVGNYSRSQFCAGRWLSDGGLDRTFGVDGRLLVDMPGYGDVPSAVLQDADGRSVLSGTCLSSETSDISPPDFCLVRLVP